MGEMLDLPPKDEFDDFGHVFGRVSRLAGGDAETFCSTNCNGVSEGGRGAERTCMQSWL